MMNAVKTAKAALRKEVKVKLDSLSTAEKARQSVVVQEKLWQHELYKKSQRLSIFLSMNDEIQTEPILRHALEAGKTCYIPRYDSKSTYMDMVRLHSWEEYESLPVTKWQIKQPPLSEQCETALSSGGLDLILIPGLAFTKEGHRMGRGRGYYDRYLTRCRASQINAPSTVALAFSEQIFPEIPTEDTDMLIDIVLSAD
ncbi:5-formyltetrahydrofolate cyclo-ligase [Procambarus clarkii]|uniref:5-formyltetrahydrofolate cyclo-ligase n=1 Tax=Procambarus clarkii TaxID=6728 RepID=UPI003743153D